MTRIQLVFFLLTLAFGSNLAQPVFYPIQPRQAAGYFALAPADTSRGLILLTAGPGQDPEELLRDSAFTSLASRSGMVLIAVPNPGGLLLTPLSFKFLHEALDHALARFNTPPGSLAIGGFGPGGVLALQYAEECWAAAQFYPNRPRAVFAVDTPVDLIEWWNSCLRDLERNSSPEAVAEAGYWKNILETELGGSPDTLQVVYEKRSPFVANGDKIGKEQYLLGPGLRLYYSGHLQEQLGNRDRDLYDLPVTPASALLKRMLEVGHPNADIRFTQSPGDGELSAWGWGMSDKRDCIYWIVSTLTGPATRE